MADLANCDANLPQFDGKENGLRAQAEVSTWLCPLAVQGLRGGESLMVWSQAARKGARGRHLSFEPEAGLARGAGRLFSDPWHPSCTPKQAAALQH